MKEYRGSSQLPYPGRRREVSTARTATWQMTISSSVPADAPRASRSLRCSSAGHSAPPWDAMYAAVFHPRPSNSRICMRPPPSVTAAALPRERRTAVAWSDDRGPRQQ